ncbi:MAG: putative capsid protein [Cressdnaviricota sp.]|nr:MAG: putative capsid protein [Cressdnaviricota sp.]
MARKFRKRTSRVLRRKPSRPVGRRRRLQPASSSSSSGGGSMSMPASGKSGLFSGYLRGSYKGSRKRRRVVGGQLMSPALDSANIKNSSGLKIGKYKPPTFAQKVISITRPPQQMMSKWTFQMDCVSGRVTAAQIPILTQALIFPIQSQLISSPNLTSDSGFAPGTMNTGDPVDNQYAIQISSYTSKLRFYNSSSNTLRARVVWYKPNRDLDAEYESYGANFNDPINYLMLASNSARESNGPAVGSGTVFDNATGGSSYTANYNHAGWPLTGTATTASSVNNTVAYLDPALVPGSPQVRRMFSANWRTVKSEDFTLSPGNQFNTSVTLKNRIISNQFDDVAVVHRKNATVIGVVYVLGQIVFSDVASNSTISTGSSQLSVMREDTCMVYPMIIKRTVRVNLTSPFEQIASGAQGIINTETNNVDNDFEQDL